MKIGIGLARNQVKKRGKKDNTTKTGGTWLGCWKNNTETPFGFRWSRDPKKVLSIFFSYAGLK